MQITLPLTEEQLDSMIASAKEKPELESLYWQLMGYSMVGGDELSPVNIVASTEN